MPEGVTVLDSYVFMQCNRLAEVVLPSGLSIIGNGAFDGCAFGIGGFIQVDIIAFHEIHRSIHNQL